jgi:hypothetical protein
MLRYGVAWYGAVRHGLARKGMAKQGLMNSVGSLRDYPVCF